MGRMRQHFTCATLLLQAGVPANVVQQRLGHKKIEITLGIYAHALSVDAAGRDGEASGDVALGIS